ncbi:MAG: hypothetical protein AB2813_03555 [Candidatus Sedimenticola endophacoides]
MSKPGRLTEQISESEGLYPTRGREEKIFERADPVVYGDGQPRGVHSLTMEQLDFYARNGFIVIPGVFSQQEVDVFNDEYERLATSDTLKGKDELVLEPDSNQPRSIFSP